MKKITLIFGFLLIVLGGLVLAFNTPSRYLLESNADLNSGKAARAIEVLESGLRKFPNDYKIIFALARAYLVLGETEPVNKIMFTYKTPKEFKESKIFQDFLIDLSEANYRYGNKKHAALFAKKYLEYQNKNEVSKRVVKNYISIGQILPDKSVELWEKAYNIAHAHRQSELMETIKALLMPKYFQIAEAFKVDKKYEDSLNTLEKGRILGKNAELNYQEALIYSELGKIDLSCREFEEALQVDPENDNYKIAYANLLKDAALKTKDESKKTQYFEKIKLLLADGEDDPRKATILNKVMNLNAKYKIVNDDLKLITVEDFVYPSLKFKIKPISDTVLKKYKVVFSDESKNQLDVYEAPVTDNDIEQVIEVTSKTPIASGNLITAKIFLNDEFVKEYKNK